MMMKHREALRADEMWLAVLVFLIAALVAPSGHAQDIATDPFVQQQLDRSNWEPGGSRFPGTFLNRGPIVLRGGAVIVSPFPKQQIGGFVLQQGAVAGQYTYTIDLAPAHGFGVHSPFDRASSASGSASQKTPTQEIDVSLSWDGQMHHPADGYDPPTGGGYPTATFARDEFTFDITGNVSGVFFAPSAGGSAFAASQASFQPIGSSPFSFNGIVRGGGAIGGGPQQSAETAQSIGRQASINPNSANETASARYGVAQTTPQYVIGRSGFWQVAAVVQRAIANPFLQRGEARRRAWWERLTEQERGTVSTSLEYAHFLQKAFTDIRNLPSPWERIMASTSGKSDFSGAAFLNNDTNEVVIAFEGTDRTSRGDLYADIAGAVFKSAQQKDAFTFTDDVLTKLSTDHPGADLSNITVIGHSLGGRFAQLVAADRGYSAYTFNAAPISKYAVRSVYSSETAEEKINNIRIASEFVGPAVTAAQRISLVGDLIADDPFGPPITIPYISPRLVKTHLMETVVKVLEEVTSY